jgi:hypothetical protein
MLLLAGAARGEIISRERAVELFKPDMELLRMDLRAQKHALVRQNMNISIARAKGFWPIYDEYQGKLATIQDERFSVSQEYSRLYPNVSDEDAD